MTTTELAQHLREAADFIEANPELGEVNTWRSWMSIYWDAPTKEDAVRYARIFTKAEKQYSGNEFQLLKQFGPISLRANTPREEVCRKVITGTKTVPAYLIEEHEEEIVEWVCDEPLLKEDE